MNIPKIIHHIAPADKSRWHPIWEKCYPTWQKHFPEFEHKMWNDGNDIDNFVRDYYPQYWQLYSDFPVHLMRIDFVRFCLLHHFGGIYADMDMFCYKNFYGELNKSVHILESPYGDEFLESSLMISEPNQDFWIECMELSQKRLYETVQKYGIKIPFNNSRSDQFLFQSAVGPNLICRIFRKANKSKIGTLSGILYNNHGLSYHPEYRTKHMATGVWGKEAVDYIKDQMNQNELLKNHLGKIYIDEVKQYANICGITVENFDFYKDYTNGGMKTHFVIDLEKSDIDNNGTQLNGSYD